MLSSMALNDTNHFVDLSITILELEAIKILD